MCTLSNKTHKILAIIVTYENGRVTFEHEENVPMFVISQRSGDSYTTQVTCNAL